jgi:uncharacterized protein
MRRLRIAGQKPLPRMSWWMLAFVLLPAIPALAAGPEFPQLSGRVVDQAGILSPSTREGLTAMLAQFEQATGKQVVVVTLRSLQGYPIEDFGYQLGRQWGIGQKGKNTGVLLIVAPNDRKVRIEVGYGLEGTLTDAASRIIIEREILPNFRNGDFNGGVVAGTAAIVALLGGNPSAAGALPNAQPSNDFEGSPWALLIVLAIFTIVLSLRNRFGRRSAIGRGMGAYPPVFFPGGGFPTGAHEGGGGGFSGGGGSFGGGGASGSW